LSSVLVNLIYKSKGKCALTPGRRHFVGRWTLRVFKAW
jgi:hypothetical protein